MSANTKIEWADASWSPWRGCTKVSAGCANCYAETLSKRNPAVLGQWGKGKPRVLAKNWKDPVSWSRNAFLPQRVFPSLCDWLDDEVPVEWLARFLALIHDTPDLDWLLLTKRPELWSKRMLSVRSAFTFEELALHDWFEGWIAGNPPSNVWIGTSVEDQENADRRVPELLKIPARLRFLSVEPMLGPVDLAYACFNGSDSFGTMPGIGWVIIGGESGPGARPCNVEWIRSVVRECARARIPCFVKQLGARPVGRWTASPDKAGLGEGWPAGLKIAHPKGGDPSEWPEDLRVRQMPEVLP